MIPIRRVASVAVKFALAVYLGYPLLLVQLLRYDEIEYTLKVNALFLLFAGALAYGIPKIGNGMPYATGLLGPRGVILVIVLGAWQWQLNDSMWTPSRSGYGPTSLEGKIAVVTGANSGIGLATTQTLVDIGAHVVMACRNPKKCACFSGSLSETCW